MAAIAPRRRLAPRKLILMLCRRKHQQPRLGKRELWDEKENKRLPADRFRFRPAKPPSRVPRRNRNNGKDPCCRQDVYLASTCRDPVSHTSKPSRAKRCRLARPLFVPHGLP